MTKMCIRDSGYTHWSMVLTGGAIVTTFYVLLPYLMQMHVFTAALVGALIVTAYEFAVGSVVNLWLGWEVWDYSALPGNLLGQICPQFTGYWLSLIHIYKFPEGLKPSRISSFLSDLFI